MKDKRLERWRQPERGVTTMHSVVVFIPLANRSAVLHWEDIKPHELSRQPYEAPQEVALNITRDFNAKISQVLEAAARKARLLYLQTIEFNDITQYAWVAEYDKREQKEEYWNVVLNKRVSEPPKAMQLIELMEQNQREKLEKRVALARSKLMALLYPFHPKNKPKLALRRNAVVFVPTGLIVADTNASYASLKLEMEAIDGARFWQDKVALSRHFGGKKAKKFLSAADSKACWSVVKLFFWMDLHESGGFEPHAKKLLNLAEDLQIYVTNAVDEKLENTGDIKLARDRLLQLMSLEKVTLQLLATKEQRDADDEESRQARA
ncbi:hypothetical protein BBJ29_003572 [Phytophthora kernoviae]|uniref:Uncharacterized protein n=1 Tax=Phytophthora kernoviae TaxID=325452 RepID=A0A3F2RWN2_9STRA|nr:hypothetical protein BBJ29_003572 [Phytophthora kernoviae]RLN65679.1 hypothetical protein BBP00_00002697 [Phytophthora kernoviae]